MTRKYILFFFFLFLVFFSLQIQGQNIKTKEHANNILNFYAKDTFLIYNKIADRQLSYYTTGFAIENEYLVFRVEGLKIENGKVVSNPSKQNYLIDLNDSIKLIKATKKHEINSIRYKNGNLIYLRPIRHYKNTSARKKDEESANIIAEKFYEAFYVLKLNFYPKEKEEFKLAELKKGKLTNPKTEISEEQRKYIVQANAANEKKDYENALMLFRKAIEINPYSYPAAYFNMALIHGNMDNYYQAVYAMKQYLILAPEAEDARKAQDKIYEWELNIIQ